MCATVFKCALRFSEQGLLLLCFGSLGNLCCMVFLTYLYHPPTVSSIVIYIMLNFFCLYMNSGCICLG